MGILGGFSGTVGTVIGSSNKKGDDLIRVKTKKKRTSNTEGQVNQRTKFSLVSKFLMTMNILLKIGFKWIAGVEMSAYNYAFKLALDTAITGTSPDFEIDYSKVQLSFGMLAQVKSATAVLAGDDVNFQWVNNDKSTCDAGDLAVLVVCNASNYELSYSIGDFTRGDLAATLPIPNGEVGDKLLLYLFFQSATDAMIVSSSQYLGTVIATE